ncbi:MAG: hypothetical protein L0Y80_11985 [Ignavibacteriae bacterium]|nr:hypothetical protein [Ignavibacteriota bacterium]
MAMHTRYHEAWYKTLTFTQKTVTHQPDGTTKEETWYEALSVPGSLRIDIGSTESGNGMLFLKDSLFSFQNGALKMSRPFIHPLLVLGFDVYQQPIEETLRKLTTLAYDLTRFHEDTWQGRSVYVVGAEKGDLKTKQFWIDKERLVFVRSLEPHPRDSSITSEIQFNKYEKYSGGWVAPEVYFYQNGKLTMEEYYSDIKVDVELGKRLFDSATWK